MISLPLAASTRKPSFLLTMELSFSSVFLLCAEDSESVIGRHDGGKELGRNLDSAGLPLQSEELVLFLMAKEMEQLVETAMGNYLERLNDEGLELSWRNDSIEWICNIQARYSFGPLGIYLAVNYLDRFLPAEQLPNDTPYMQQQLAVACISLAAKMEETVVPQSLDLQVCDAKHVFEAMAIQNMVVRVLITLKWRMHSVTPFSFIDYFLSMFTEGMPLPYLLLPRCPELILDTMKETKFLQFKPSEIAATVALSAAAEAQDVGFNEALVASKIPVDKENVGRCREAIQEMVLENLNSSSPSGVLDASCFTLAIDDNGTSESWQITSGNYSNNFFDKDYGSNDQACSPASKRIRLSSSPTS